MQEADQLDLSSLIITTQTPLPLDIAFIIKFFIPQDPHSSLSTHLALAGVSQLVRSSPYPSDDAWRKVCLSAGIGKPTYLEDKKSWKEVAVEVATFLAREEKGTRITNGPWSSRMKRSQGSGTMFLIETAIQAWESHGMEGLVENEFDGKKVEWRSLKGNPFVGHRLFASTAMKSLRVEIELLYGPGRQILVENAFGITVTDLWIAIRRCLLEPLPIHGPLSLNAIWDDVDDRVMPQLIRVNRAGDPLPVSGTIFRPTAGGFEEWIQQIHRSRPGYKVEDASLATLFFPNGCQVNHSKLDVGKGRLILLLDDIQG